MYCKSGRDDARAAGTGSALCHKSCASGFFTRVSESHSESLHRYSLGHLLLGWGFWDLESSNCTCSVLQSHELSSLEI